jgi:hypothetical protein
MGSCRSRHPHHPTFLWSDIPVSPRLFYRTVAVAEAVTWTLLLAGMLLKYVAQAGSLGVLIGEWRTTVTDDSRDHSWVSRLLRWMLNHPVILVTVFTVAVIAILTVLLIIGPPGGWK